MGQANRKTPNFSLAVVEWWDAHQQQDELTFDNVKKEHKPALIQTHGYILIDDEVGVWVASEWLPGDPETFRQHTFIPRGMLHKITYRGRRRGVSRSHNTHTDRDTGGTPRTEPSSDVGGDRHDSVPNT